MAAFRAAHFAAAGASAPQSVKKSNVPVPRNQGRTIDDQLRLGKLLHSNLIEKHGLAKSQAYEAVVLGKGSGSQPSCSDDEESGSVSGRLPKFFFTRFIGQVLRRRPTDALKTQLSRAFRFYIKAKAKGPVTMAGLRALRKPRSCRKGSTRLRCPELGHALLQWFTDELLGKMKTRSDGHILLNKARELAAFLEKEKIVSHNALPSLDDAAGRMWISRWRKRYRISKRHSWNRLKVSWSKVKSRTRTLLSNIFRFQLINFKFR